MNDTDEYSENIQHFAVSVFPILAHLFCALSDICPPHLLLHLLLSAVSLSSCVGVPLTTSVFIAELSVWPEFVCYATPLPLVS